jgi:hypothetical protein
VATWLVKAIARVAVELGTWPAAFAEESHAERRSAPAERASAPA